MGAATVNDQETASKDAMENKGPRFGLRHIQVVLMFFSLAISYTMRTNLSVAIVAMTDKRSSSNPNIPTYNWTNSNVILSSFYWGYITLQVLAGQLGKTYGTKWLLFGAMFVNATACLLTPFVASAVGSYGVMACRILQGLAQGFFSPSISNLLGKWAPPSERSRMGSFTLAGPPAGMVSAMAITGLISASSVGWPASFYFFASLGYTWMLLWWWLGGSSPATHNKISQEELEFIESSLKSSGSAKPLRTPWKNILTSVPVCAFVVAQFGQNWGYSTLLTEIPSYLSKAMDFNMKSNSVLSAAPYVASFLFSFIFGILSDYLINNNYLSRQNARKLFNTIGTFIPAAALVTLGFLPKEATVLSVTMLVIAVGINAAVFVGFQINPVDLAPNFSGIIYGIGNSSSTIMSIIAPLLVQFVVTDASDKFQWRIIFIVSAVIYVSADIFFVIFAAGEPLHWNNTPIKVIEGKTEQEGKKTVNEKEKEEKPKKTENPKDDIGNNTAPASETSDNV